MKQERAHQHRASTCHVDADTPSPITLLLPFARIQPAEQVRAGYDAKRTVCFIAVIQMKAHRQHLFEYLYRRLNKQLAFFFRPSGASLTRDPPGHWNAEILMEWYQPIRLNSLGEQSALGRYSALGKQLPHALILGDSPRKLRAPWHINEATGPNALVANEFTNIADDMRFNELRDYSVTLRGQQV